MEDLGRGEEEASGDVVTKLDEVLTHIAREAVVH